MRIILYKVLKEYVFIMQSASDRNFYQSYNPPSDLISEFKAPQDSIRSRVTQYLPPTTSIPSISKSSPSNVIKFLIPEGGAIDTNTIRLHMNISVTVPDVPWCNSWLDST